MGLFGQRLRQLPRENFKVFFIGQPSPCRAFCLHASGRNRLGFSLMGLTDIEHVYIGAVIELMSSQLPHPDNREAGLHPPALAISMHGNAVLGS